MKESDSENMPLQEGIPAIEDIPIFEEIEEELGFDAMDFFSSMVRPDPVKDEEEEDEARP